MSQINSASEMQMDYMKLLITQLQNQNPLEPMNNDQMASQLAQFSQLQQLESMNTNFADVLAISNLSYANSLIGKEISFLAFDEDGMQQQQTSIVEEVGRDDKNQIILKAGDYVLGLDGIISVKNGI